jgi:hypothetical protein
MQPQVFKPFGNIKCGATTALCSCLASFKIGAAQFLYISEHPLLINGLKEMWNRVMALCSGMNGNYKKKKEQKGWNHCLPLVLPTRR